MSDPLSVSASVLTVVGSGFAIAKELYQIADGIGSAGAQVRIYADEIRLFSELLGHTRDELRNNSQRPRPRAEHLIMDILHVFESVLEPPKQLQATLNPLLLRFRSSPTRLLQIALRVRWLFSAKDKLLWYRESLKVLNGILNTTLTAMKTTTEIDNNSNWSLTDPMQLQLDGFLQPTIQPPLLLDGTSTALEGVLTPPALTRLQLDYPVQPASQHSDPDSEANPRDHGTSVGNAISGTSQPQGLIPVPSQEIESSNDEDKPETSEIVEIQQRVTATVDAQYNASAQEIWEDLRTVSRKALRYAEDVLRDCSQVETKNQPSTQEARPAGIRKGPDQNAQYVPVKTVHSEMRIPGSQAQDLDVETGKGGMNVTSRAARHEREPSPRPSPLNELLTLKIMNGKRYQVPYCLVQEWEDAKAVLLSFKYPPLYDRQRWNKFVTPSELLDNQGFDLIGPNGQYIIPRFWTQTVQPTWTVELRFKDSVYCIASTDLCIVATAIIEEAKGVEIDETRQSLQAKAQGYRGVTTLAYTLQKGLSSVALASSRPKAVVSG
ncbi:hypothetical protein SLS60_011702 [Paraconiothyrium brasiliense]|uniref:Ubiquitin-like domain-containing protein n=1 Tax=Paraconiothyrium brasiliense TaxID=300254 RepID=A0ABR3QI38_9PLEO